MENSSGSSSSSTVKEEAPGLQLLLDAALQGNVATLQELLRKDPLILHRPPPSPYTTPPLHTACRLGHTDFAAELLRANTDLSNEVEPHGDGSSPLHLAARNGHVDVVTCLVSTNPNLCFARDGRGMNPVHVAAVYGHLSVVNVLATAAPAAARERASMGAGGGVGDKVLHLCVKRNRVESAKLVVELVGDEEMVNAKDADGNTVLHLATAQKDVETVKFLLNDKRTQKNALNSNGLTPLDLLTQQNHRIQSLIHRHNKDVVDEIYRLLKRAKAKHSKDVKMKTNKNPEKSKYFASWIADHRSSLMVVASLIATMAFQVGVNPPGGVWQQDDPQSSPSPSPEASSTILLQQKPEVAGTSVLAHHNNVTYDEFLILNSIGYFLALTSILLLISGLPFKRVTVVVVMVTMWFAVTCMAATYWVSVLATMPYEMNNTRRKILIYSMVAWFIMMILFVLGQVLNVIVKLAMFLFRFVRRFWRCCFGKKDDYVMRV